MINKEFWRNKKVFVTGHTGFKGAWLCLWLHSLGAKVTGYALQPPTDPNLYELVGGDQLVRSRISDIRDLEALKQEILLADPEIVIHMAAQPLVRDSYRDPVETYSVNMMGTVNLLEASRGCKRIKAIINVTSDKCYKNKERESGYKEFETLGGYDPYSSSKACSELITAAYRNSFFGDQAGLATVRAGNVIGGGDWGPDRLVPDFVRAVLKGEKIKIRNPYAVRPWQHVLEPLCGYLMLAEKLYLTGQKYAGAWNFGPDEKDAKPVEWIVKKLCDKWGKGASYVIDKGKHPHEAHYLRLDCSKVRSKLGWKAKWDLDRALNKVVEWTRAYQEGTDIGTVCLAQIDEYENSL